MSAKCVLLALCICCFAPAGATAVETFDQYQCFEIRSDVVVDETADLHVTTITYAADGSPTARDCELDADHRMLCVASRRDLLHVDRQNAAAGEPVTLDRHDVVEDQICYRAQCSGATASAVRVADAFGVRRLAALGKGFVCTPVLPLSDDQ